MSESEQNLLNHHNLTKICNYENDNMYCLCIIFKVIVNLILLINKEFRQVKEKPNNFPDNYYD